MSKAKLFTKILKASGNFSDVVKDKVNPHFKSKYADVNAMINAVEGALNKEGLILLQPINGSKVSTVIVDTETGEQVDSSMDIPSSIVDPQKMGSAVTYLRRYTLQSLLALPAVDDDGNMAANREEKTESKGAYGQTKAPVAPVAAKPAVTAASVPVSNTTTAPVTKPATNGSGAVSPFRRGLVKPTNGSAQ